MESKLKDVEVTLWICVALLTIATITGTMHLLNEHATFLKTLAIAPATLQSGVSKTLEHVAIFAAAASALLFVAKAAIKLRRLRERRIDPQAFATTA